MSAHRTRVALLAALGLAALGASSAAGAQERRRDRDDEPARTAIDTTFAFAADGVVDLTLVSGSITVVGWGRAEARVRAHAEDGGIRADLSRARIELDVRRGRGHGGETRYEVTVPVGARVVARTTSGDVTVRALAGDVELHTTSGELEASSIGGRATLASVSGGVTVRDARGGVDVESVSGTVEVRDAAGEVRAETVSGRVRLRNVRSRAVRAETVSGEVEFEGTLDAAGRYDFDAHSGDVRLTLPADAGAQVSVETFSGSIDSDFPMTLQPTARRRDDERRMELTIGRGGARVRVQTFSGSVTLEKVGAR